MNCYKQDFNLFIGDESSENIVVDLVEEESSDNIVVDLVVEEESFENIVVDQEFLKGKLQLQKRKNPESVEVSSLISKKPKCKYVQKCLEIQIHLIFNNIYFFIF